MGYTVWRVAIVWRRFRDEPLPPEVRQRSHAVSNEATVVQAGLKALKDDAARKKEHPLSELVRRMRQAQWEQEQAKNRQ